ncbi:non-heme ferritin [Candidatus Palibaumannia cicadellinicola]|uniref:Ferritin n=1 Tax=Candidatus Palibaumannia cicadellinicola TaxID=186490 RepID=A0A088NAS9_9GAMM|nr:non-heme ferritin [Candidatus Baumannia cicadellinicola]AIN47228.1 Ferritin-like protein 2 [Candidatus Baumannia cicadellinicola]
MLKPEVTTKLNEQLNLECYSTNLYLQMSAWCHNKGFEGISQFFQKQSREETNHIYRIFDYLNDTGTMPLLGAIQAPPIHFSSLTELINFAYEHEKNITNQINRLVHVTMTLQDYSTFYFLQWYVAEQHKEEKIFKSILDKFEMIAIDYNGLFLIDQMMKNQ